MDALAALLAAADSGSFTGAAETLGVTHGSVSRRIATLEAWIGVPLFERHGRGVRLTPAGQRFAAETRQALGTLSRSAEQWRPWRGRQTVRVSLVPSFAQLWLLPRLADLERDDLHLDLRIEHRVSDLDARESDIAIRYGSGRWDGLDARLLFAETLKPAAAPGIARKIGAKAASRSLLEHALLHDSDIRQWRTWLAEDGVRYRPRWQDRRFEDYDMVLTAAEAGLGIALLRLPLGQQWLTHKRLVTLGTRVGANPSAHYICTRAGETRPAVVAARDRLQSAAFT
jgi:DNA-binding transcriptional LysR family regulator